MGFRLALKAVNEAVLKKVFGSARIKQPLGSRSSNVVFRHTKGERV
jgi:hypothetical protein